MNRLEVLIGQIEFARRYTLRLLDSVDEADWFRRPIEGVSHIAWQAGHLAVAEYRLTMLRVRGEATGDAELFPAGFLSSFGINSVPDPDPSKSPAPSVIREILDRVHARAVGELSSLDDAGLDAPLLPPPHSLCSTKAEVIAWCSQHEMLHAGQIGLLRRLLGKPPMW